MANDVPQLQACKMRVTALDLDGKPTVGSNMVYVSDGMISVGVSPQYEDGTQTTEKNACGGVVVNFKSPDNFLGDDLTITLATPDPVLVALLTNGTPIIDGGDATQIGTAGPRTGILSADSVSIEVWAKRVGVGGAQDGTFPWAWYVYPRVQNLRQGDYTHEDATNKPVFTGRAVENELWGDGPDNLWEWSSTSSKQWMPTAITPPTKGYHSVIADA